MSTETTPSHRALEAGEDMLANAIKSGVQFGARCGCPECDRKAHEWVAKIWRAMKAAQELSQ